MTDARISKIKQKDGWITIQSVEKHGETSERDVTFKCSDEPHQDLNDAFEALTAHARRILEWPSTYADGRIRISGVSFSYSDDTGVEGAVMTGMVLLESSDSPFSFNTPHLPFDQYSPTGNAPTMPDEAKRALAHLREEAQAFMDGKRAQGELFGRAA